MFSKGVAIIAITKLGVETALKIKEALTEKEFLSIVYAPEKYSKPGVVILDKKLNEFIKDNYQNFDAIVGVMATGIIIRAVAPLLQGKLVDPAVIGVDASGRFVISLLSGHYGGANELARQIADAIDGTPVVTTASEVTGKKSIDEVARALHLKIENPESLVPVNSAIVNGGKIVLLTIQEKRIPLTAISGFYVKDANNAEEAAKIVNRYEAGAIITRQKTPLKLFGKPVTVLKPLTISVGLGARKEIPEESVVKAVNTALARVHMPLQRVDRAATVSIKKESQSMISAAKRLGLRLEFVELSRLSKFQHPDLSADSEIVKRNIGVGGVCERAALITAGEKPRLILKKTILNGVTVAIAEGE
jgi:cobalt-precorrin 5A hydrolase